MAAIIDVAGLKKSYGSVQAVKGIDFSVDQGMLFSFLGPNGAGKSTTIDILCTLLSPDDGDVIIDGMRLSKDDVKIRESIGVVFQNSVLDPMLTLRENLMMRAGFYGMNKTDRKASVKRAAEATDLHDFIDRPYGKLSGGQRRRADIARALVNTPKILFLDEPTTGLDPQTKSNVWKTISKLRHESGTTVFLTTHYMEEAAESDYITVIDNGLIAARGTPIQLKSQYTSDIMKIVPSDMDSLCAFLKDKNISHTCESDIITVKLGRTKDAIALLGACEQFVDSFEVLHGTMDDVFISITGREIRENV